MGRFGWRVTGDACNGGIPVLRRVLIPTQVVVKKKPVVALKRKVDDTPERTQSNNIEEALVSATYWNEPSFSDMNIDEELIQSEGQGEEWLPSEEEHCGHQASGDAQFFLEEPPTEEIEIVFPDSEESYAPPRKRAHAGFCIFG